MENPIEEWAQEFITAYYTSVVYSKNEVVKFYDPENAKIYREDLQDKPGISLNESLNTLVPRLAKGDRLIITQYNAVPIENGFNLSVFGKKISPENTSNFAQFFTLVFVQGRAVVVADSLQNLSFEHSEENLVQVPRPKNSRSQPRSNSSNTNESAPKEASASTLKKPKHKKPKNSRFIYVNP